MLQTDVNETLVNEYVNRTAKFRVYKIIFSDSEIGLDSLECKKISALCQLVCFCNVSSAQVPAFNVVHASLFASPPKELNYGISIYI